MKFKILKKLICCIGLVLLSALFLASCSEWDGLFGDDVVAPDGKFTLVASGTAKFVLTVSSSISKEERALVDALYDKFVKLGVDVPEITTDSEECTEQVEFLFGTGIKNRDGFAVNADELGESGYISKVVVNTTTPVKAATAEEDSDGTEDDTSEGAAQSKTYKIIVAGGSTDAFATAMSALEKAMALPTEEDALADENLFMDESFDESFTGEFALKSITVGQHDLRNFVFSYQSSGVTKAVAKKINDALYDRAGYKLPLPDEAPADAKYTFKLVENSALTGPGFTVNADGKTITMTCQNSERFIAAVEKYINIKLVNIKGDSADLGGSYTWDIGLRYTEFGAVGDGKADDFSAIEATHRRANELGLRVIEDEGKTYYLGLKSKGTEIPVKTDVNWGGATFRVDDRVINPFNEEHYLNIFVISPDSNVVDYTAADFTGKLGLFADSTKGSDGKTVYKRADNGKIFSAGQTTIKAFAFGKPTMLKIKSSKQSEHVYIRYGGNANDGAPKCEMILVDADGNVDKNTPITFDYYSLSEVQIYSADDESVTIEGGTFINIANVSIRSQAEMDRLAAGHVRADGKTNMLGNQYYYYGRGIRVSRSNTVVKNITHLIEDETKPGDSNYGGYPYRGWLDVSYCNHTLVEGVSFTGHRFYQEDRPGGGGTQMGTYEINALEANDITWRDCNQLNSITSGEFWGIMGTNFVKNLNLENCDINRFDIHQGAFNATVKNCTIGRDFNIVGFGKLEVVNTKRIVGDCFFKLRNDYGSIWNGDVILKNCSIEGVKNIDGAEAVMTDLYTSVGIFDYRWAAHDFGYTCYMPQNIEIENFKAPSSMTNVNIFHGKSIDVYIDGVKQWQNESTTYKYTVSSEIFTDTYTDPVSGTSKTNPNKIVPPKAIKVTGQSTALRLCNIKGTFDAVLDSADPAYKLTISGDSAAMVNLNRRT